VVISPSGGSGRTISGAIVGPLIDLNGADKVTINGLNIGGNALTISNLATGAASTVRLIGDASSNVLTNVSLLGSGTSTTSGTHVHHRQYPQWHPNYFR
jgi:trimeric autotransporter adhesin